MGRNYPDVEQEFVSIYRATKPFTLTSLERMYGLYKAVEYVTARNIAGDFVECGVWRGGSSMVAAMALRQFEAANLARRIWLYDTFEGMTQPSDYDVQYDDRCATERHAKDGVVSNGWESINRATLAEVTENMAMTGYPAHLLEYVVGKVEETLLRRQPKSVSILRLDTDWYESTKCEMEVLYPLLSRGGVLIVDDYGHWKGSRKAVDEYFAAHGGAPYLARLDYTGRLAIKP